MKSMPLMFPSCLKYFSDKLLTVFYKCFCFLKCAIPNVALKKTPEDLRCLLPRNCCKLVSIYSASFIKVLRKFKCTVRIRSNPLRMCWYSLVIEYAEVKTPY